MRLSEHFTLAELSHTGHASHRDINRREAEVFLPALKDLAAMLEVVRAKWGPVRVNSGFRGPALNRAVGGSATSQHSKGEAADIVVASATVEQLHKWIVTESGIKFGQCILEMPPGSKGWVHLSLGVPYRAADKSGQVLHYDGKSYTPKRY